MTSITTTAMGFGSLLDELRNKAPARAKNAMKRGLRASTKEFRAGIQAAVPPPRTRGHSNISVVAGMGERVWSDRDSAANAKVGYGVGKKRGTYRPRGIFILTGTVNRWTGSKTRKVAMFSRRSPSEAWKATSSRKVTQTGNARKFRGRVQKSGIVPRGVASAAPMARQKFEAVLNRAIKRAQS
jgi:hypothetical protein